MKQMRFYFFWPGAGGFRVPTKKEEAAKRIRVVPRKVYLSPAVEAANPSWYQG